MPPLPFLLTSCHVGTEPLVKEEIAVAIPGARFAYGRQGLATFKLPNAAWLDPQRIASLTESPKSLVFPQQIAVSLGRVDVSDNVGESASALSAAAIATWKQTEWLPFLRQHPIERLHLWRRGDLPYTDAATRDRFAPRDAILDAARHAIISAAPANVTANIAADELLSPETKRGVVVLDVIIDPPRTWWIGCHIVGEAWHSRFAGGVPPIDVNPDAVSRAWYKFDEGVRWSGFPIGKSSRCVDLGASPGGASQALLGRGASVIGIDPGEMAPSVLGHPRFTHIRRRIREVPHRILEETDWLIADMNVPMAYTLDVLADILQRDGVAPRGLLFTIKLFQWEQAKELPALLAKLRKWGYNDLRVRHLAFNRQEVMVAARRGK